jgi:cell division protein FtsW (lipid II flippase)
MLPNDTLGTRNRPHIQDKWGATAPPVPPPPTVQPKQPDDEQAHMSMNSAKPVQPVAGRISHRSKIICLVAGMLSLTVSALSAYLLSESFARAYSPPRPLILIALSLLWVVLEVMPLYAVLRGNGVLYIKWMKRMLLLGPVLMAVGRFGVGFTAVKAAAVVLVPMALVLPALPHLLADERTAPARRMFLYLLCFGLAVQFACSPSDGLAQVRAIAVAVILLGFFASIRPVRLLAILDQAGSRQLATALWWISGLTLAANASAKIVTGSVTPGVTVGGIGIAPYWLAIFPILTAVGLELREGNAKRLGIGLGSVIIEYLFLLREGGTALMLLVGVLLTTCVLGTGRQVLTGLTSGLLSYCFLKSGWAASLAGIFSKRIADRLIIWHGTAFNAQLASYLDVITMSGLTGFCGAARVSFLVSAASKDFVLGAVVAESGLLGLSVVTTVIAGYLLEIARSVASQSNAFRRAAGCAILLALCASVIVSYSPVMGWLMPTGLPLPALSRGAAVTVAACGSLIVVEWLNEK